MSTSGGPALCSVSCQSPEARDTEQTHQSPHAPALDILRDQLPPKSRRFITSKGWVLEDLLISNKNFCQVPRVSASDPYLAVSIDEHEKSGVPLIIEGYHKHPKWPSDLFTVQGFCADSPNDICTRNVHNRSDRTFPLAEWIKNSRAMSQFATPDEAERWYGKDAPCPPKWNDWLHHGNVLPSSLLPEGSNNMLLHVPKSERVETLMCYLGIGDTYTPCHKDICASSGQNIMCYTENSGSSFWFMTSSSTAPAAANYLHELRQELDHETYVISVEELAKAPFKVYIAEQKLGDMVLVPPRSCHQVINHGGITIKTSWSRMTIDGLVAAIHHELPIYRRVCRPETYRVKYTVYHSLLAYIKELEELLSPVRVGDMDQVFEPVSIQLSASTWHPIPCSGDESPTASQRHARKTYLARGLLQLAELFDEILVEEYCKDHYKMHQLNLSSPVSTGASLDKSDCITCDFCGSDIFQSFFECRECVGRPVAGSDSPLGQNSSFNKVELGDGLIICPSCYVEGRSCRCESMTPLQYRPFDDLLKVRRRALDMMVTLQEVHPLIHNYIVIDERQLFSEGRLGIFRAGCLFQRARRQGQGTRSCRFKDSPHTVPIIFALPCKKCHAYKCFEHLLTSHGIHSAEAILALHKDHKHEDWHRRHSKIETKRIKLEGLQAEKRGIRLELRHQLVKMASTFRICNPLKFSSIKLGWYDQVISYKVETPTMQPLIIDQSPLSPLSSLTPSPRSSGGLLPDTGDQIVQDFLLDDGEDYNANLEFVLQHFGSRFTSDSNDSCKASDPANMSSTPAYSCISDHSRLSEATTRKRQPREMIDHVLVPSAPVTQQPSLSKSYTPTHFADPPGIRKLCHNHHAIAASPMSDEDDSERSVDLRLRESEPFLPSFIAGAKVGPPVKRMSFASSKRTPLRRPTDDVKDERPSKRACVREECSEDPDKDNFPSFPSNTKKSKPSSLPRARAITTAVPAGPSNLGVGLDSYSITHGNLNINQDVERTSAANVTWAINQSFDTRGSQAPWGVEPPLPGLLLLPDPPALKALNHQKLYEKKFQALEKRLLENEMLREGLEAQMKNDRQELMQEIRSHQQEIAKLQKALSDKDAQLLRYAEINRAPPTNQIVLADQSYVSVIQQLLEPRRDNWHPSVTSYGGQGRGRGRNFVRTPFRHHHKHLLYRHKHNAHQAIAPSPQFPNEISVSGHHQRSQMHPQDEGTSNLPMRGSRGWSHGRLRFNWRGNGGVRPLSRSNQGYMTTGGSRNRQYDHGVESQGSGVEVSEAIPSAYRESQRRRRKGPKRLQSSHEDMMAEQTSMNVSGRGNTGWLFDNGGPVVSPNSQALIRTNAHQRSPSHQSEYWEDRYEEDSLNQERLFMQQVEDAPNQKQTAVYSAATIDVDSAPLAMENNPWI